MSERHSNTQQDTGPKQRGASSDNLTRLLAVLGQSPHEAGEQYERLRSKLIFFFSSRRLSFPEDLADEVLDRLARRIGEGLVIASLPAFALGIARLVMLEQSARKNTAQTVEDTFWNNVPAPSLTHSDDEDIAIMERCLKKLPSSDATLLRGYYAAERGSPMQARRALADRLGISANTLRQRVFLARQILRTCMTTHDQSGEGRRTKLPTAGKANRSDGLQ